MIQKEFRDVVFEFAKEAGSLANVLYIFLFGSAARGEADKRSDIDFCVLIDDENKKMVSSIALDLEKKYDKSMQLVISRNFSGLDKYFISQLFKEGILLYGKSPLIQIKGIGFDGYALFSFSLKNLSQPDKMKLKRALYGYSTIKKGRKLYRSFSKGLVAELNGLFIGRGAVFMPIGKTQIIKNLFDSRKIKFKRLDLFKALI